MAPPQIKRVQAGAGRDAILAAFYEDGGVIIEGFLSPEQVNRINADIDPAIEKIGAGSKHSNAFAQDFHGSNTKRLTNLVTLSPQTFGKETLDKDLVHELCEKIFNEDSGTYWMTAGQVIEIGPGNKAQPLHRDQNNYPLWSQVGPDAPEATVNFLTALTDFTEENGATRVLPGSHKWTDLSDLGNQEDTIPAVMKAGDALFICGRIVHGGGSNKTKDFKRRAMAFAMSCSYLTPEEAYPFMVPRDIIQALSPRAQSMIGFRSQFPKNSPGLWQWDYEELANHIGLGAATA
ncbi:toxin biosynthesis protein [Ilyonectria destructans]|nr:toxin biosynthesis protein [Ilyonectria destructans]